MHSSLVRIQNVFGFFTTVAFCVAALIAMSVVVSHQTPTAELELRNVQVVKGRPHYYSTKKEEYAHIKFDLEAGMSLSLAHLCTPTNQHADLTSLFSWNTKQVFVYVTATFPSRNPSSPPSEAIIWDAIIPSPSEPWHPNTYIHPSKSGKTASRRRNSAQDTAKAYPDGASPGILKLSNQKPKYQITTPWSKIGGLDNCTLQLKYNIQPWVGALVWSSPRPWGMWEGLQGAMSDVFQMPLVKSAGQATKTKDDLKTETGGERNRGSPA